jgi:LmbE family N-acetylglucosaminyl deacetylase
VPAVQARLPQPGADSREKVVTALVLSAHLDDAVLSCGGRLGPGTTVVTLFARLPPAGAPLAEWDADTGAHDSHARVLARWEEDNEALGLLGVLGHRLPLLDGQYRAPDDDPSVEAVRLLAPLVEQATSLWLPAAIGAHPDHVLTRQAGLVLARGAGVPVQLYADLPYAFLDGWPPAVTRGDPEGPADGTSWSVESALVHEVASVFPEPVALRRRVHRLDPAAVGRKRRAIAAYATQLPLLDAQCGGRLSRGDDLALEVAWELG